MESQAGIKRITEVGIAVRDLDKATYLFVDVLGGQAGPIHDMPLYNMRYRMVRLGKVDFELMEPIGEDGVIAKFIESRGEGLHHIGFAVDNIDGTVCHLEGKGVGLIGKPHSDSDGDNLDFTGKNISGAASFIFSHPKSLFGVLAEFIQYPEGYQTP